MEFSTTYWGQSKVPVSLKKRFLLKETISEIDDILDLDRLVETINRKVPGVKTTRKAVEHWGDDGSIFVFRSNRKPVVSVKQANHIIKEMTAYGEELAGNAKEVIEQAGDDMQTPLDEIIETLQLKIDHQTALIEKLTSIVLECHGHQKKFNFNEE